MQTFKFCQKISNWNFIPLSYLVYIPLYLQHCVKCSPIDILGWKQYSLQYCIF